MDITHLLAEIVGIVGVVLVITAYFLLQSEKMSGHSWSYLWLNAFGSFFILLSLLTRWNLPAFLIELTWLLISLWGMWRLLKRRFSGSKPSNSP